MGTKSIMIAVALFDFILQFWNHSEKITGDIRLRSIYDTEMNMWKKISMLSCPT